MSYHSKKGGCSSCHTRCVTCLQSLRSSIVLPVYIITVCPSPPVFTANGQRLGGFPTCATRSFYHIKKKKLQVLIMLNCFPIQLSSGRGVYLYTECQWGIMHVLRCCLQDFVFPFSFPPEDNSSLEYESLMRGNHAAEHLLVVSLFSPSLSLCVPVGEGVRVGWEGGGSSPHFPAGSCRARHA